MSNFNCVAAKNGESQNTPYRSMEHFHLPNFTMTTWGSEVGIVAHSSDYGSTDTVDTDRSAGFYIQGWPIHFDGT